MKIYYRQLPKWQEALRSGNRISYETNLKNWCYEHLGPPGKDTWVTCRPTRSNFYTRRVTRAEGIIFNKDEYATAFLLVFK